MATGTRSISKVEHAAIQEAVHHIYQKIMPGRMEEPLDGDETVEIAEVLRIELDLLHGNITSHEYEEQIDEFLDHKVF